MSDVKNFELSGQYRKKGKKHRFRIVIRALNEEQAKERAYSVLGGKHNIARTYMKFHDIRVIEDPEEIQSMMMKTLATKDDFEIRV